MFTISVSLTREKQRLNKQPGINNPVAVEYLYNRLLSGYFASPFELKRVLTGGGKMAAAKWPQIGTVN